MPRYPLTVLDYQQKEGYPFTVTVCGYSGKVRDLVIGDDSTRYLRRSYVDVTGIKCEGSGHCLAFSCSLNKTEPGHVAHMLDMWADEPLDEETAGLYGTKSSVEYLIKFAEQMNEVLPAEMRKRQNPLPAGKDVKKGKAKS
jgi:hypothetical protein